MNPESPVPAAHPQMKRFAIVNGTKKYLGIAGRLRLLDVDKTLTYNVPDESTVMGILNPGFNERIVMLFDPYQWSDRNLVYAHTWIRAHIEQMEDGQALELESIIAEVKTQVDTVLGPPRPEV